MKVALMVMALSSFSVAVMAAETTATAVNSTPPVEEYTYATHLDIAKVVSMSEIPNVCEVVPARMTYEDSKGVEHVLEYRVMGNGCTNG
jgi:hypothetical protein